MSSTSEHKAKAEHNEKLAASLTHPFNDWAVIVTFYAAVQYVEAFFASTAPPYHSTDHSHRDDQIGRSKVLNPQWKNYRRLKDKSIHARYEAHITISSTDVSDAKSRLDDIKKVILPKL